MTLRGHGLLCRLKHNVQGQIPLHKRKSVWEASPHRPHVVNKWPSTRSGPGPVPSPGTTLMNGLPVIVLEEHMAELEGEHRNTIS